MNSLRHLHKQLTTLSLFALILWGGIGCSLVSCSQDDHTYSGPDHIQWADTLTTLPVMDNDSVFDVTLSAMHTAAYDRRVGVELLVDKSNAIQGYHFDLLNHTALIPAGQLTAKVRVRGYASHTDVTDSLGFQLRLVTDQGNLSPLYGATTTVMLQKACRFDINNFVGYALVESSWIYNYMPQISERLVRVERDPDVANRIVLRNLYYDGFDVHIDLTSHNILTPDVHFEEQPFAPTTEAFGTIYGNGKIMMSEPAGYVSYYSSCERFIILYTDLFVRGVGDVGTFVHIIKYVTDDEAEQLIKDGISH